MLNVQYRLYQDSDAEAVTKLLKDNRYFYARFDLDLTADYLRDILHKRGMYFAVVGELEGRIIAVNAIYPAGSDRVALPHQVFGSTLLIDKDYRKHLYSFPEIHKQMLYHLEEHYPDVTEILMELYTHNLQPLYLQRMFGSVILGDFMPNPRAIIMHNYSPGIRHFFRPMRTINPQNLASAFRHVDKKDVLKTDTVKEGRFVTIPIQFSEGTLEADCNIYSGRVCRFRVKSSGQSGCVENGGIRIFNDDSERVFWQAASQDEKGQELENVSVNIEPGASSYITVPSVTKQVVILNEARKLAFCLCPNEDWRKDPCGNESADEPGTETFTLKKKIGMLAVTDSRADKKQVVFQEVWPYFTAPYLFGTIVNDPDRIIQFSPVTEEGMFLASQRRNGYEINRAYTVKANAAEVSTTVKRLNDVSADEIFDPIFALHVQDMNGSCDFHGTDSSVTSRTFDYVRDDGFVSEEIMFYEFQKQSYAQQPIEKLVLHFGDSTYMVTAERPFRAYLQFTCIFVRFFPVSVRADGWEWNNDIADFGTIRIQKL